MAKSGEYGGGEHGHTDGWPSLLGDAEQRGTWNRRNTDAACNADILRLLSMLVSQWRNHVIDDLDRCEGCVLWR
jgi:hypothetical protein